MKKTWFFILALIIVFLGIFFLDKYVIKKDNADNNQTITDYNEVVPNILQANYISFSDWKFEKKSGDKLNCQVTPAESSLSDRVYERDINGQKYCISALSEGAAGSIYTTYSYSTVIDNNIITLSFVARYPQCSNYDDPQKTACVKERETWPFDNNISQIISYLVSGSGLSAADACQLNNSNWLNDYNECEGISKEWCEQHNGIFKDCESACRHNPEAQSCTMQCVSVCQFDTGINSVNIEKKTDFYKITAKYPLEAWDQDGLMENFVKQLVAQREEDWKIGGEEYNNEKKIEAQFPDRPQMVYTLDINYNKFESEKDGTVSYLFTIGEYTGGANGNETVQTFTFNSSGVVTIESLLATEAYIQKDNKSIPNDLALSYLLLEKAQNDSETFPDLGITKEGLGISYLKDDGLTLDHDKCNCDGWLYASNLQNFTIDNDGLIFYFNKGAINIRAAGVSSIKLNWSDLEPFLRVAKNII